MVGHWSVPDFESKICPPEALAARLALLPRPLVFTNGCFDILHRGHVTYLAQARSAGAALVLALNTDASVRRLGKGGDRPVNPLENRAAVAAALESVDLVTWFDEDTPAALIEAVKPEILVKGGDWPVDKIVGAVETLARGGKVFSIPFLHQTSTTKTWQKSVRQRAENDGFEAFALAGVGGACRRFAATRLATGAYGGYEAASVERFLAADAGAYTGTAAPA